MSRQVEELTAPTTTESRFAQALPTLKQQNVYLSNAKASVQGAPQRAPKAPSKPAVVLTESEQKLYGNRCPAGYSKLKILGK